MPMRAVKFWFFFGALMLWICPVSGQEDWFLDPPPAIPEQIQTVNTDSFAQFSSQDTVRLLKQYFNNIINELEMEKQILSENNAKVRTEIDRITLRLDKETITPTERRILEKDLSRLQQTLVSNELAYQEAQAKTQGVSRRIGTIIDEKDSLNTAYTHKLVKAEEQLKRKFLETMTLLLISTLLLAITAISVVSTRRIRGQKRNIETKNKQISAQAQILQEANDEIKRQNRNILASMSYAGRIQSALLPSTSRIKSFLPESFILLRPRDKVSGDFYWFEEIHGKIILVAADCTGHGVPGAIMSMIGMEQLTNIVNVKQIYEPHHILDQLNDRIRYMLKQTEHKTRDGMDISLCVIEEDRQTLHFAGAKSPLLYIQTNAVGQRELKQIKGNRKSVGGWQNLEEPFTTHTIRFEGESPVFYLFSDGFQDQFGGGDNRKFMKKRFKELVFEIHQRPFFEQKEILQKSLDAWQGKGKQTDDILVIGFKL